MNYRYVTKDEQDDVIASALIQREKEHLHYEVNRVNYLHMLEQLSDLPDEWPQDLVLFKGLGGEQLASVLVSESDFTMAARLQFRDRLRVLLSTTILEQNKVENVYLALEKALPLGARRDAAIERAQSAEAQTPAKIQLRELVKLLTSALTEGRRVLDQPEGIDLEKMLKFKEEVGT